MTLANELLAARDGRPVPPGMLDVVQDELAGLPFLRPRDWDLLVERRRPAPLWAIVWPSGEALTRAMLAEPQRLAGRSCVELGCGLGVASLAAARAGARVAATDAAPEAVVFARRTLAGTGARVERLTLEDAAAGRHDLGTFNVVLAADLLYEPRHLEPLLEAAPALLGDTGELWLADPGRPALASFEREAARRWPSCVDLVTVDVADPATHRRT